VAWLNPIALWTLLAVPIVVALALMAAWSRRRALRAFGDTPLISRLVLSVSARRRRYKAALVTLAVFVLAVALAGPRLGTRLREAKREGVDLVIALDVSQSMMAEDVLPNRLAKAKFEINNLIRELAGDRVGLILFAGDAFVQCPMTLDYAAVRLFLDVADPSMIPVQGTDFGRAIEKAAGMLESSTNEDDPAASERTRAVLIVSDGENHAPEMDQAMRAARDAGIVIFAAGVGETRGVPIPVLTNGQRSGYKEDAEGIVVSTKLEEELLQELAQAGGYYRISRTSSSLPDFRDALLGLQRSEFDAQIFEEYDDKFQWPLGLGLVLLMIESFISEHRRRRNNGDTLESNPDNSLNGR
jgi:Ca-activated chloride channel family protein